MSRALATPMVTTVAVDSVTGNKILQTAVGRVDLAMFIVSRPDGDLMMTVGPVLSYYEMAVPRTSAWTEETWLQLLGRGDGPHRPPWTRLFVAGKQ